MEFLRLSSEDLLEYIAVNKAQQHFPALLDFLDLHFIVERGGLHWATILENAAANATAGAVWFGLLHCKELLGTSVPNGVLEALGKQPCAWGGRFLRRIVGLRGGPLDIPPRYLEGPWGRLYEALLEGSPRAAMNMLFPLVFPPREKLDALAGGSYWKYARDNASRAWRALTVSQRAVPAGRGEGPSESP